LSKGWGREWIHALIDTSKHSFKLYDERKTYQAQRQRADRDILRGGNLPLTRAMNSSGLTHVAINIFESIMFVYWFLAKKIL
jgi:hypothetical protein